MAPDHDLSVGRSAFGAVFPFIFGFSSSLVADFLTRYEYRKDLCVDKVAFNT